MESNSQLDFDGARVQFLDVRRTRSKKVNTFLSVLALLVSSGVFIVHYRNQVERRHGEIIQLKTQIISTLSNLQQRFVSILTNCELYRIELRRLPDTKDKYESIETFPKVLKEVSETKTIIDEFVKEVGEIDTRKANRSAVLLHLQSFAAKI